MNCKRILPALLLFSIVSSIGRDGDWKITVNTPERILVKEPVACEIVWHNTGTTAQRLALLKPTRLQVSRENQDPREYFLFQTLAERLGDIAPVTVTVQPNETFAQSSFWIFLGTTSPRDQKWDFLFPEAGSYTLQFPEFEDVRHTINVIAPQNQADIRAKDAFTPGAASIFMGERRMDLGSGEQQLDQLRRFFNEHSNSYLAPYAALGLANMEWLRAKTPFQVNLPEYERYSRFVLERAAPRHVKERALFGLARALAYDRQRKEDGFNLAREYRSAFPTNQNVKVLESVYGQELDQPYRGRPRSQLFPQALDQAAGSVRIEGIEQLPASADRAFQSYWQSIAAGDLPGATHLLDETYLGSEGTRSQKERKLKSVLEKQRIDWVRINILSVVTTDAYEMRATPRAAAGAWNGEILSISHTLQAQCTSKIDGSSKTEAGNDPIRTVLFRNGDQWRIISEDYGASRNERAAALAKDLVRLMRADLPSAMISSGQKQTPLIGELSQRLPQASRIARCTISSLTMEGSHKDEPLVNGVLWVETNDSQEAAPHDFEIKLVLAGNEDALELFSLHMARR